MEPSGGSKRHKPNSRKFVLAGRGRVIGYERVRAEILRMTAREEASGVRVVYLGTPDYESQMGYDLQAKSFEEAGCVVEHLKLTQVRKSREVCAHIRSCLEEADVIAVSGGNTLYAMKQWKKLGVDVMLQRACDRGAVMCGGSAGAICWYEGGHSDSRDPTTLLHVRPDLSEEEKNDWSYINVKGLGLLPGVCCPHHDSIQSNGVPRSEDFHAMMLRQHFPVGVCIDDQAALAIDGNKFQVLARDGKSKVTKKFYNEDGLIAESYFYPDGTMHDFSLLHSID